MQDLVGRLGLPAYEPKYETALQTSAVADDETIFADSRRGNQFLGYSNGGLKGGF